MRKRIFVALLAVLAVISITPAAFASSGGDSSDYGGRTKYSADDDIWRNLCVGGSAWDFGTTSGGSCGRAQAAPDTGWKQDTSSPPNIEAGLCIGASLDFSRASANNCLRKQADAQSQKRARPTGPPNIEAGLCVGASLDLSASSAARCTSKQAQAQMPAQPKKHHPEHKPKPYHGKKQSKQPHKPAKTGHKRPSAHAGQVPMTVTPTAPAFGYAALGDSTAAGTGLPTGPNPGDSECGRSAQAYPHMVAQARGLSVAHIACSGATMQNLLTKQRIKGTSLPAQLDSAFVAGTPQLITITAGANDLHWDSILIRCTRGTCGTAQDKRTVESSLANVQAQTQAVLEQIKNRSGGSPPKTIITGYYNPISANCAASQSRVTADEIAWVSDQLARLNDTLQNVGRSAPFATFVPIDFTSHDICSPDPWVQGLNDSSPLHPNAAGQKAIADTIIADP